MSKGLEYTLSLATAAFSNPLRAAQDQTAGFKSKLGEAATAAGNALDKPRGNALIGAISKAAAAAGGLAAVFGIVKSAIGGAMDDESTNVAFSTLIGNAEKTKETIASLKELGASTPFEFASDLAPAARNLIAFGVSADEVTDTLRRVGDVAAGVQAPLGEISEIYGKARVQNQLFAEDLNQLGGRGIPAIQELASMLGVSEAEVKKLASEGKITFPMLDQAFRNMTAEGGKFFNMMSAQSKTSTGLVSTLKDNFGQLLTKIGKPVVDNALKPLLETAIGFVDKISAGLDTLADLPIAKMAGSILTDIGGALNTVSAYFEAGLETAANAVLAALHKIPGMDKLTGLDPESFSTPFETVLKDIIDARNNALAEAAKPPGGGEAGKAGGIDDAIKKATGESDADARKRASLELARKEFDLEQRILELKAGGEDKKAEALERELELLRTQATLQQKLGVDAGEALRLAGQQLDLQDKLNQAAKGESEEEGRKRSRGFSFKDAGFDFKKGLSGFSGVDYVWASSPGRPLKDDFKFTRLDALIKPLDLNARLRSPAADARRQREEDMRRAGEKTVAHWASVIKIESHLSKLVPG